jgi:hypothetical protein
LRYKDKGQRQKTKAGHPFEASHGETHTVGLSGQTYEMLSTDVGREQGGADYGPREVAPRQEIVFTGLSAFGKGEADEKRD